MEAANKIAIITDTCCDLPQEYLKEYPIFCVPLVVTSGTEKMCIRDSALAEEMGRICRRDFDPPEVTNCRTVTMLHFGERPLYRLSLIHISISTMVPAAAARRIPSGPARWCGILSALPDGTVFPAAS